jgi:hypothetical protein
LLKEVNLLIDRVGRYRVGRRWVGVNGFIGVALDLGGGALGILKWNGVKTTGKRDAGEK